MAEELHRKPKEVFILDCFLENVNTDDLNDNPLQPRKRKFPKKKQRKKIRRKTKTFQHCLEEHQNMVVLFL